jgi:hypothetical protein
MMVLEDDDDNDDDDELPHGHAEAPVDHRMLSALQCSIC